MGNPRRTAPDESKIKRRIARAYHSHRLAAEVDGATENYERLARLALRPQA